MIPWEKNAVSYINDDDAGVCPVCGQIALYLQK